MAIPKPATPFSDAGPRWANTGRAASTASETGGIVGLARSPLLTAARPRLKWRLPPPWSGVAFDYSPDVFEVAGHGQYANDVRGIDSKRETRQSGIVCTGMLDSNATSSSAVACRMRACMAGDTVIVSQIRMAHLEPTRN